MPLTYTIELTDLAVVVVGYGSIGSRHARILRQLGYSTAVVSRRETDQERHYVSLQDALDRENPDYVVIANRTSEHYDTFKALAHTSYRNRVLVEKPLFGSFRPVPPHHFAQCSVGYNFRFHPVIRRLRVLLQGQKAISAQVYVGQHLSNWRPDIDYRQSYSTKKSGGGGVLRDLSHEFDLVNWFFHGWTRLTALGGHLSDLEIETDDTFAVLLETKDCPVVTVQMNYLDRVRRREILVNTNDHTFRADLIANTIQTDDSPPKKHQIDPDATYQAQHRAALFGPSGELATLEDGVDVLRIIAAAEQSVRNRNWVNASNFTGSH